MPNDFHYDGFSSPNGTIVPDDVFDVLAPQLTEAELRVLLYIIRRTFGFKRQADDISLRQMVEGITTRDGRRLDRGAGVAKSAAIRAVKALVAKGIIVKRANRSAERGDEPTTYALRFRATAPASSTEPPPCPAREHPRVLPENPQPTAPGQADECRRPENPVPVGRARAETGESSEGDDDLIRLLTERGLSEHQAQRLVQAHADRIREKVDVFDWVVREAPTLITKSRPGWLYRAITDDFLPEEYVQARDRELKRRQAAATAAKQEAAAKQQEEEALRTKAEKLLTTTPEEYARRLVEGIARAAKAAGRPPWSAQEWSERLTREAERFRQERDDFFRAYPRLRNLPPTAAPTATAPEHEEAQPPAPQAVIFAAPDARRGQRSPGGVSEDQTRGDERSLSSTRALEHNKSPAAPPGAAGRRRKRQTEHRG